MVESTGGHYCVINPPNELRLRWQAKSSLHPQRVVARPASDAFSIAPKERYDRNARFSRQGRPVTVAVFAPDQLVRLDVFDKSFRLRIERQCPSKPRADVSQVTKRCGEVAGHSVGVRLPARFDRVEEIALVLRLRHVELPLFDELVAFAV